MMLFQACTYYMPTLKIKYKKMFRPAFPESITQKYKRY